MIQQNIVIQQNSVFIDPESCGSSVGYYLRVYDYDIKQQKHYALSANVVLADCTHKIDWDFSGESLDKIDAAIGMLKEFRKKYTEAVKMVEKLNK